MSRNTPPALQPTLPVGATCIYRTANTGAADLDAADSANRREELVGYIDADGVICKMRWGEGIPVGRCDGEGSILRTTAHGERELGQVLETGQVRSAGLFQGGDQGWLEPDGVVIQGGLILGEQEVGRVEGPRSREAAAALLLLFLPDEAESDRRAARNL